MSKVHLSVKRWVRENPAASQLAEEQHKKTKLVQSTLIVGIMTLISRIMGFMRDIILAQTFGASPAFDAFVVAFKIPNFLRRLFAEGAFSQSFVPILAEYRSQQGQQYVQTFINNIAGLMSMVLILVIVVVEICVPLVVIMFAPGFIHDATRLQLAEAMLHIMFPYLLLIAFSALFAAILNAYHRFSVAAISSVLLNVALISGALWWAPYAAVPVYVLAWSVLIGGAGQLIIQAIMLYKLRLLPRPRFSWTDQNARKVMKKMFPALFGVSVMQISILMDNFFASFLPFGSISWLYYSDQIAYLPLGMIGVALAVVIMPTLSRAHSSGEIMQYMVTLDWALRCLLVIGIPASLGLIVLAGPILATVMYHGAFNNHDLLMTRKSLSAFAGGLPAFMLVKVLAAAFYSRRHITLPVKIAAIALGINMLLDIALMIPLAHMGLALATSISSWFNALLLFMGLIRYNLYQPQLGWRPLLLRLLLANLALLLFLLSCMAPLMHWLVWDTLQQIAHLGLLISAAFCIYCVVLWLSGMRLHHLQPPKYC